MVTWGGPRAGNPPLRRSASSGGGSQDSRPVFVRGTGSSAPPGIARVDLSRTVGRNALCKKQGRTGSQCDPLPEPPDRHGLPVVAQLSGCVCPIGIGALGPADQTRIRVPQTGRSVDLRELLGYACSADKALFLKPVSPMRGGLKTKTEGIGSRTHEPS